MNISELSAKIKSLGLKVRPAAPPETIQEWEGRLGLKLPEDYAAFVTQIGDGWEKQVVRRSLWPEMRPLLPCGDLSLLRRPFPYKDAWIWENRETNPLPGESSEDWDRRVADLLRPIRYGNIPLLRGACGEKFHLILNGECSGEIWIFTDVGIAPCSPRTMFAEWLSGWIESRM